MTDVAEAQYNRMTNLAGYHDVCGGSHWLRLMFLIFSHEQTTVLSINNAYIMIKNHCTEQQSYAIMVTHHMYYDNPPLYHTHFMEVPGFKIHSQ